MKGGQLSARALEEGRLWSARARDWAELQEHVLSPAIDAIFEAVGVRPGMRLLDVGCGAGGAARTARNRGAHVSGLDVATGLLEIARERVPQGDFRLGEVHAMPWLDDTFDVVLVQYADDYDAALAEAHRVVRSRGWIGIVAWGSPDECEPVAHFEALGALMPPSPAGTPAPLETDQRISDLITAAGLWPVSDERVDAPWAYPDLETALRALLCAGPAVHAIEHAGEPAVRAALTAVLADFATEDGGYLLRNTFRALIARAS